MSKEIEVLEKMTANQFMLDPTFARIAKYMFLKIREGRVMVYIEKEGINKLLYQDSIDHFLEFSEEIILEIQALTTMKFLDLCLAV